MTLQEVKARLNKHYLDAREVNSQYELGVHETLRHALALLDCVPVEPRCSMFIVTFDLLDSDSVATEKRVYDAANAAELNSKISRFRAEYAHPSRVKSIKRL